MAKKVIVIVLLVVMAVCFAGCQTMKGLGGDIKWTGEQVEAGASNFTE